MPDSTPSSTAHASRPDARTSKPVWAFVDMPRLDLPYPACPPAPTPADCYKLWDKYEMLPNIRRHSLLVAQIAANLARRALNAGIKIDIEATLAAGLLHDLAKTWCIANNGSHDLLGASWTIQETGHYGVAQGVILHVNWPWPLPQGADICQLPILVLYADKRARHDQCVTLAERFDDLLVRYGKTASAREGILKSYEQAKQIEAALSQQLGYDLNEDSFDSGRMVH